MNEPRVAVDQPSEDSAPSTPEPPSKKEGFTVGVVAACLALVAAVWYGIQSAFAAWVYAPLGVRPYEIGLSSADVLAQATVGLVVVLVVALIIGAIWAFASPARKHLRGDPGDLFAAQIMIIEFGVEVALRALFALIVVVVLTFVLMFRAAYNARESFQRGERPVFLWGAVPAPWAAQVAFVQPVTGDAAPDSGGEQSALPSCALFLGQAEGTVVLAAPDEQEDRTLRVPASSIILDMRPDMTECPSGAT